MEETISSLFAIANREGDHAIPGTPKSKRFLGERKHSEALSF